MILADLDPLKGLALASSNCLLLIKLLECCDGKLEALPIKDYCIFFFLILVF